MRRQVAPLLLAAGALLLLASLYLPYIQLEPRTQSPGTILGLLSVFADHGHLDGWAALPASAAALTAVLLAAASGMALNGRPQLRLPLELGGFLLAYLGLAVLVGVRSMVR